MDPTEEMAEMHRRSNNYNPNVVGESVGPRQSSRAIVAEYAQADRIFVVKTRALANVYYQYRLIKGDGNCGWRALAFGYFEVLLRTTDRRRIERESARLKSYNTLLNTIGYEEDLYIDFVQETLDLLERTAANIGRPDGEQLLLASFNDESVSNSIITHFRLITSAWMKSNAAQYEGFLPNLTIDQYRTAHIDPYQVEIEHLGMHACIDAVLKPAGIAVDVMYLDRSEGDAVNTLSWEPESPNDIGIIPRLRLLYRPGHYDILYSEEDIGDIQSYFANPEVHFFSIPDPPVSLGPVGPPAAYCLDLNPNEDSYLDIPGISLVPNDVLRASTNLCNEIVYDEQITLIGPEPFAVSSPSLQSPPTSLPDQPYAFRNSKYQLDVDFGFQEGLGPHSLPCQTDAMKHAGECAGHFRNHDFQPIIWSPKSESRSG